MCELLGVSNLATLEFSLRSKFREASFLYTTLFLETIEIMYWTDLYLFVRVIFAMCFRTPNFYVVFQKIFIDLHLNRVIFADRLDS